MLLHQLIHSASPEQSRARSWVSIGEQGRSGFQVPDHLVVEEAGVTEVSRIVQHWKL